MRHPGIINSKDPQEKEEKSMEPETNDNIQNSALLTKITYKRIIGY